MSKFIPQNKRSHEPQWFYVVDTKTGEVKRLRRGTSVTGKHLKLTTKEVYQRVHGNKYYRPRSVRKSFAPSEYPTGSGKFVPSNIHLNINQ